MAGFGRERGWMRVGQRRNDVDWDRAEGFPSRYLSRLLIRVRVRVYNYASSRSFTRAFRHRTRCQFVETTSRWNAFVESRVEIESIPSRRILLLFSRDSIDSSSTRLLINLVFQTVQVREKKVKKKISKNHREMEDVFLFSARGVFRHRTLQIFLVSDSRKYLLNRSESNGRHFCFAFSRRISSPKVSRKFLFDRP